MAAVGSIRAEKHPGADSKAAPIDLVHLRRYTLGDHALEVEILGLFAGQLPITIAALKSASTAKAWGLAAHTLKGSARAVGAWPLATLAERAEGLLDRARASERKQVVSRLEEAAGEASAYIATLGDNA
jgi:HPt (histidine-containing phosphotransfer) domain-containing protein